MVDFYVRGRAVKSSSRKFTPTEMIKTLQEGLPVRELHTLRWTPKFGPEVKR